MKTYNKEGYKKEQGGSKYGDYKGQPGEYEKTPGKNQKKDNTGKTERYPGSNESGYYEKK